MSMILFSSKYLLECYQKGHWLCHVLLTASSLCNQVFQSYVFIDFLKNKWIWLEEQKQHQIDSTKPKIRIKKGADNVIFQGA